MVPVLSSVGRMMQEMATSFYFREGTDERLPQVATEHININMCDDSICRCVLWGSKHALLYHSRRLHVNKCQLGQASQLRATYVHSSTYHSVHDHPL
jgi:hypothetical protein